MKLTKAMLDEKVSNYEEDVEHNLTFREILRYWEGDLGLPSADLDSMTDEELDKYDTYLWELVWK